MKDSFELISYQVDYVDNTGSVNSFSVDVHSLYEVYKLLDSYYSDIEVDCIY